MRGAQPVQTALKETNATSVSVAFVADRKTALSQTFGRVDNAGTRPSPITFSGVGWLSKMVAATAVMQLVDQGKVSLDARWCGTCRTSR